MFLFLSFFWFIRITKAILFWLYLWQLKEYHTGRFLDHFRTDKGKQLFLNALFGLKIILIPVFFAFPLLVFLILFFLYLFEVIKGLIDLLRRRIKKPVFTKKIILLISVCLLIEVLVLFILFNYSQDILWFTFWLLVFDILTPIIASIIVLFFQPLAVLARNQIIKKAKKKRDQFKDLIVVGITGSYGKTSTKEFLATILSEKSTLRGGVSGGSKVLKTAEHQNSEVGISQCILNDLKPEQEIFICEMGGYNMGGIKLLCDIAKPKIGILTGINEQHMATFGSQENIIKGKYELVEDLLPDGLAIFNGSDHYCLDLYKKTTIKKRVYGFQPSIAGVPSDFWAHNLKIEKDFITFKVFSQDGSYTDFRVNLMGAHNVINVLGAIAVAKELGMSLEEIARACQRIEPWQSGIQLKRGINGLNIIDATYSANPDGLISHLDYLKIWEGKKIIVMSCLIELGKASKEVHKRIGQKIGQVCDLAIIITKERFKELKEGAVEAGMNKENILFIENPKKIFKKVKEFSKPGGLSAEALAKEDVILLESRVPNQLIKNLVI